LSSAGRADDLYCLVTRSRVIITGRQSNRQRQVPKRRGALVDQLRYRASPGRLGSPGAGAGAGTGLGGGVVGVVGPGPNGGGKKGS